MRRLFACLLLVGLAGRLPAEELPDTIKLSVRANGAPIPALKYRLVPEAREMKPGNAALDYYRGFSPEWWGAIQRQPVKWWEDLDKARHTPLDKLNRNDMAQFPVFSAWLRQVDRGAR